MKKYFITGIDTDIGKTFISLKICKNLKKKNINTGYFKPLQSGAYEKDGILKAPDVEEIKKQLSIPAEYSYLLKGEVSPYLASKINNIEINIEKIKKDIDNFSKNIDTIIIEGAGGLYCPMSDNKTFADLIKYLDVPSIIVATPKLGRLNHILMTLECAKLKGIEIKGIIINKMPNNPNLSEKHFIEELKDFTNVPILAVVSDDKDAEIEINL